MKKLIPLFISIFFFFDIHAQVVQIGSGTAINTITEASPVNIYYRRQVSQFIYTANEIIAAGGNGPNTLSQMGFYVSNQPIYAIPDYTIKIKHTTDSDVNNALPTNGWTTVKTAFSYSPAPGGYDMIVFDTPFAWDGIQNIAIEICWSQVQPNWNSSGQLRTYTSNNGYRYTRDDDVGSICGEIPATILNVKPQVQLTFKTTTTWSGSVNSDWFNNDNWDAGTPDPDLNAVIPAGIANMPIINAAGAECKNLEINASATLTLGGSNGIDISGDWTNNGTFNGNNGTVTMKGALAGNNINSAANQRLANLTIDNVNGATIASGSIEITGTLGIAIASGNFNTNDALTLISDASGTARIDQLSFKCKYTLDMSDSWGDSWNGGFITVLVDGISVGDFSAKGFNSRDDFYAPTGSTVEIQYTSGSYENENSYILYDGSGNNLFTDGPSPSSGIVFTNTSNCSFFNPINGNITMQRYIDAGSTNWRFITSAVADAAFAQFNDDFETSGYTGSLYPDWPTAANPLPSIYGYDETEAGDDQNGFVAVANASNIMAPGEGFWVWSGDTITGTQAFTFDLIGPPNTGNIDLPISYTNTSSSGDGWNMTGNPYPSSLDWDSPNITKTDINNAIYIWNPETEQFASYSGGIGTNGGSRYIASSQAFWIQATGVGAAIQVTEESKTANDVAFFKQNANAPLRIKANNTFGSDELAINFNPSATAFFDPLLDAEKIASNNNSLPTISSFLNGSEYSINQLDIQEINIPIKVLTGITGTHVISIENVASFSSSSCLILEDIFTSTSYNLNEVNSFTTTIYDTTQTARFLLHIGAPVNIETTQSSCFGNNDAQLIYTKNSATPFDIIWKNSLNTIIAANSGIISTDTIYSIAAGIYYIETTDALCGNTIDTVTILEPQEIIAQFSSDIDTVYLANGGNINFTNQSANANYYHWEFGDLNSANSSSPAHQYTQAGLYPVTLSAYQTTDCFSNATSNILVIDDFTTEIENYNNNQNPKVWINNNYLMIDAQEIKQVVVKDALGRTLVKTSSKMKIDLTNISSQTLIINIKYKDSSFMSKINHINN